MTIHFAIGGGFKADFDVLPQKNAKYAIMVRKGVMGWQQPTMAQVDHIDADY